MTKITEQKIIKPFLASKITDYSKLKYPLWMSPKLDGIFVIISNGVVYSRSGKPIASNYVQETFGHDKYNNISGELIYGEPNANDVFNKTTSFVRSKSTPDGLDNKECKLYVFDYVDDNMRYVERHKEAGYICTNASYFHTPMYLVVQTCVNNEKEMLAMEQVYLNDGYEGGMLRDPNALYKHGRATEKSQALMKVKRFEDDEALIIGVEELMHNANVQTKGVFGNSERSSHKENLVPMNTLGALVCETKDGVVFNIGTGYTQKMRDDLWKMFKEGKLLGEYVKYKSFKIGVVNAPRLPVYKEIIGLRMKEDMS